MLVGGEFIEAGGDNGTKFNAVGMSVESGCSSDLGGVTVTDAGIIDGKPFETMGCVTIGGHGKVCCDECCCSTGADGRGLLQYS
jgi:hypothetical protein